MHRQFRFWYLFLRVCSGRVDIPQPQGRLTAGALDTFTDAAGGSTEAVGRGTGGVLGDWWYYIPRAKRVNAGGWKVDGKKVGRKLAAGSGGRRPPGMPGSDAAGLGGQCMVRVGVPQRIQPELSALHYLGQSDGHGCRRHRLPARGDQNHQVHRHRGHIGRPSVQGQVQRLQADSGAGGMAAASGASQNPGRKKEMAGQAFPLR